MWFLIQIFGEPTKDNGAIYLKYLVFVSNKKKLLERKSLIYGNKVQLVTKQR